MKELTLIQQKDNQISEIIHLASLTGDLSISPARLERLALKDLKDLKAEYQSRHKKNKQIA